jgi:hypothetical protein
MAWATLTGPMPRWLVRPGARSTMACSCARLALSARVASRSATASRLLSAVARPGRGWHRVGLGAGPGPQGSLGKRAIWVSLRWVCSASSSSSWRKPAAPARHSLGF